MARRRPIRWSGNRTAPGSRSGKCDSITLPEAKEQLRNLARSILISKATDISTPEVALVGEVNRARIDPALTQSDYPIIQAIQADRSITFAAAATFAAGLVDAWIVQVAQVIPKYLDVIDRIQAAATISEAKSILDELEALTP